MSELTGRKAILYAILLSLAILLVYGGTMPLHHDVAGGLLTTRFAASPESMLYGTAVFQPPAEYIWYSLNLWARDVSGLGLTRSYALMTLVVCWVSSVLAFLVARQGSRDPVSLLPGGIIVLAVLPILFKNIFGLREALVMAGLWPWVIMRLAEIDGSRFPARLRTLIGLWLGLMLMIKVPYALSILLVEALLAAGQRDFKRLFRLENLIAGGLVMLYVIYWRIFNAAQFEAIPDIVSNMSVYLAGAGLNLKNTVVYLLLGGIFSLLVTRMGVNRDKVLVGFGLLAGALLVALVQQRWYSHHMYPVMIASAVLVWISWNARSRAPAILLLSFLLVNFLTETYRSLPYTFGYQGLKSELSENTDIGDDDKVGLFSLHLTPYNQVLAEIGAVRWQPSPNIGYFNSSYSHLDLPENADLATPPVRFANDISKLSHDTLIQFWTNYPFDYLIVDETHQWPLKHFRINWLEALAEDAAFQEILAGYCPVFRSRESRQHYTVFGRCK